jgi:hypothetical protein
MITVYKKLCSILVRNYTLRNDSNDFSYFIYFFRFSYYLFSKINIKVLFIYKLVNSFKNYIFFILYDLKIVDNKMIKNIFRLSK